MTVFAENEQQYYIHTKKFAIVTCPVSNLQPYVC